MEHELSDEELQQQMARKKKAIWIGVAAAVGTLFLGWLIWLAGFASEFSTFTDNDHQITINYPNNWSVNKGYEGTVVAFISPLEDSLDTAQENLNIAVADLSQKPLTLDQYTQTAINQMKVVFEDTIEVTESKSIFFAGQSAHQYSIYSPQPNDLVVSFIWFIKDNKAYTITYMTQKLQVEKYQPMFDEMLNSFSILAR